MTTAAKKIEITRAELFDQLAEIGRWHDSENARRQVAQVWEQLFGDAEKATIFIRKENEFFGESFRMGSDQEKGFYNSYLPICHRIADAA